MKFWRLRSQWNNFTKLIFIFIPFLIIVKIFFICWQGQSLRYSVEILEKKTFSPEFSLQVFSVKLKKLEDIKGVSSNCGRTEFGVL